MKMVFTTTAVTLALASFQVHASSAIDGKITKGAPIILDQDGKAQELKLASPISQIRIWDGHTTAEILTQAGEMRRHINAESHLAFLSNLLF